MPKKLAEKNEGKMERILKNCRVRSFFMLVFVGGMILAWGVELRAETKPNLAILPFHIHRGEEPGRLANCPICRGTIQKGEILSGSQNTLTRLLQQKIETMGAFEILPLEKVEKAFSEIERGQFELKPMRSFIQLGKTLDMDFIFIGILFRFEERIGSHIGAEKPASVGFDVHLIRLRDEKMVWKGKLDETQRPLSENLLKIGSFFRRKASWLTAEELSSVGMDEMLKGFPGLKELEE
jgi:hypothetical protein